MMHDGVPRDSRTYNYILYALRKNTNVSITRDEAHIEQVYYYLQQMHEECLEPDRYVACRRDASSGERGRVVRSFMCVPVCSSCLCVGRLWTAGVIRYGLPTNTGTPLLPLPPSSPPLPPTLSPPCPADTPTKT
jgi:hypothetical protein